MKARCFGVFVLLLFLASPLSAQTIDCDLPQQASQTIWSGRPFTVQFCVPSLVTTADGDVANRIDGYTAQVDAGTPTELGKLTLGAPAAVSKLQPASARMLTGVAKGNHTVTITPWNCPLATDGVTPDCTKPKQNGPAVVIPFVVSDLVLSGPPPAVQKGRVIR